MDHATGTVCLHNMSTLCDMGTALCDMRSMLCDMRIALCCNMCVQQNMGALCGMDLP